MIAGSCAPRASTTACVCSIGVPAGSVTLSEKPGEDSWGKNSNSIRGTIATAITYGRAIFTNIRRFIIYLLSGNLGEILAVAAAAIVAAPLPLLPLQILFINLIFDIFPALALGVSRGGPNLMHRPPRDPDEPILKPAHWRGVVAYGVVIAVSVLAAFAMAFHWLEADREMAVTIAFLCFGFSRLWHVFNMRGPDEPVFRNDVTSNPYVWGAMAICLVLLGAAVFAPVLSGVLQLYAPSFQGWLLALSWRLAPLIAGQAGLAILAVRDRRQRLRHGDQ